MELILFPETIAQGKTLQVAIEEIRRPQSLRKFFVQGEAYIVSNSHIQSVLANPELFGFTREELTTCFHNHGERIGWEGKARNEILVETFRRGWIRARIESGRMAFAGIPDRVLIECDSIELRRKNIDGFLALAEYLGLLSGELIDLRELNHGEASEA